MAVVGDEVFKFFPLRLSLGEKKTLFELLVHFGRPSSGLSAQPLFDDGAKFLNCQDFFSFFFGHAGLIVKIRKELISLPHFLRLQGAPEIERALVRTNDSVRIRSDQ